MTVRPAILSDVPRLVALAQIEHAASRFKDRSFNKFAATANMEQAVSGLLTRVFISDGGFIAGMVQPSLFNRYFTAYELCWYAEDGSGMKLLKAFADWAKKMRAVDLVVSNYAGMKDESKFTRVMHRAGFEPLGTSYTKPL
jgi:hypothetical protein